VIAFLGQYASTVRDIAILVAAGLALLSFALSLRTRVDAEQGSIIVWRLPLLRYVKVEGPEVRNPSARELAEEGKHDDALIEDEQKAESTPTETIRESPAKPDTEQQLAESSGWFHIPTAMDRSRNPVDIPMISFRRSTKGHLHLQAKHTDQDPLNEPPNIRVNRPSDAAAGIQVPLSVADAGLLRDAIVGSWVTSLWS